MAAFKFGDKVKTKDGREAVVQEDQEEGASDVKIMIEGDDFSHVVKVDELSPLTAQD